MINRFLYLIRHGETSWNAEGKAMGVSDIPLTPKGKRQAKAIGQLLKDYPIDVIYSSPLDRAHETAKAIHKHHQEIPLFLHDTLKERNYGVLEGKTYDDIDKVGAPMVYKTAWYYLNYHPLEGECLLDVLERANIFVDQINSAPNHKHIVIVSHGTFQRVLLCTLLGIKLYDLGDIHFDNASLSIIDYYPKFKGTLQIVNYTKH